MRMFPTNYGRTFSMSLLQRDNEIGCGRILIPLQHGLLSINCQKYSIINVFREVPRIISEPSPATVRIRAVLKDRGAVFCVACLILLTRSTKHATRDLWRQAVWGLLQVHFLKLCIESRYLRAQKHPNENPFIYLQSKTFHHSSYLQEVIEVLSIKNIGRGRF